MNIAELPVIEVAKPSIPSVQFIAFATPDNHKKEIKKLQSCGR